MSSRLHHSSPYHFLALRTVLASLATSLIPALSFAVDVTKTWDAIRNDGTAPPNNNFFQNTNWDLDVSPTWTGNTDSLLFNGGGTGTSITMNIGGGLTRYLTKSITFADGVYTFTGAQNLTIGDTTTSANNTGNLTNNTTNVQTFNLGAGTTIAFRGGTINAATGGFTFGVNTTLSFGDNANSAGSDVFVDGAANVIVNSLFTGAGTDSSVGGALIKNGTGTLFLQSDNVAWNGRLVINSGAVEVNKGGALGSTAGRTTISGGTATGRLNVKGGINVSELLYLEGRTAANSAPHLVNLTGNNTIAGGVQLNSRGVEYGIESTVGTLTIGGDVAYDSASGATTLRLGGSGNGVINGKIGNGGVGISLLKDGAGTWSLVAANPYTGSTSINEGRLNLSTTKAGGGAIAVGDGATLGVTLAGGNQPLASSSLTLGTSTGAMLDFDIGAFGNPAGPVIAVPSFATTGANTISVKASGAPLTVGQFTLIDYNGSIGGAGFGGLTLGALPARVAANLVDDSVNSRVVFNVSAFDLPKWTGAVSNIWDFDDASNPGTGNWKEVNSGLVTRYIQGASGTDSVLFDESAPASARDVILSTALTPATVTVNNSALTYTFLGSGNLTGGTSLVKQGTGTLVLANMTTNDYTGTTTIAAGTLQIGDGSTTGAGSIGSGSVVNHGTLVLNRPDAITIGPVIGGDGAIIKQGTGTATISGTNDYTGWVNVTAGTLRLANANALGSIAAGTTVQSGATLDVNGRATPIGETITVSGSGVLDLGAIVNTGTGNTAVGVKNVTLTGATTFGGTTRWDIRDNPSGLNAAGFELTKVGTNSIFFANLGETHLGDLILTGGRIAFEGDTTLGDQPGIVAVSAGSELGLEDSTVVHTKVIELGGGQINVSTGVGNRIAGPVTVNGSGTIRTAANMTLVTSGVINGTGNLNKIGTGTLILTGNNSYQGTITIAAGTTRFGNDGTSGAPGTGDIVFNPAAGDTATLAFRRSDAALVVSNNILSIGAGTNVLNIGSNSSATPVTAIVTLSGTNSFPGAVNLNGGSLRITNSTALGVGPKTVTIANAFKPSLRLDGSTASIALPADLSFVTSNDDADSPAIRNEAGNNSIGGTISLSNGNGGNTRVLVEAGTLTLSGSIQPAGAATSARTLILDGAGNGTVEGILASSGQTLGLTKTGTGTWTLNAANTYTGPTAIQGGILKLGVTASLANSSRIDLSQGATFDAAAVPSFALAANQTFAGSGSVRGAFADAPDTVLAPGGGSLGTLTFANSLSLNGGGRLQVNLSGTNTVGAGVNDLINVGGSLALNGSTTLEIVPTGAPLSGSYQLLNYGGSLTGGAANFNLSHSTRYTFTLTSATPGQISLGVTGVAKSLTWSGDGAGNVWDVNGTSNFDGGTEKFFHTDSVTFDGSTANAAITIPGQIIANGVTVTGSQDYTFTGSGGITGAPMGLIKSGSGVLTLGTANSFTGPTQVNAGALLVNGSISGSAVSVVGGATLGGNGTITTNNQPLALASGARLAPGAGIGTLTLNLGTASLDLGPAAASSASGALIFELGVLTGSDRIRLSTGSLSVGSGVLAFDDFAFSTVSGFGAGSYTLFDTGAAITGSFDPDVSHLSGFVGGLPATLLLGDSGRDVVLSVVPEPGSAALVLAAGGALLGLRRRVVVRKSAV